MSLLEPFVIPGFDRALLKLLFVVSGIVVTALVVIITSLCMFPLSWLIAAIRANRARHTEMAF
jgi:hypothetical protein